MSIPGDPTHPTDRDYIFMLYDQSFPSNIIKIGITGDPIEHLERHNRGSYYIALFSCPYNGYLHDIMFSKFRSTLTERPDLGPDCFEAKDVGVAKTEFVRTCTMIDELCVRAPPPLPSSPSPSPSPLFTPQSQSQQRLNLSLHRVRPRSVRVFVRPMVTTHHAIARTLAIARPPLPHAHVRAGLC